MDERVTLENQLVDGHLSETALEALSGHREDLLHPDVLAHHAGCASCAARVEEARAEAAALSLALRVEIPDVALSALVESALAHAEAPASAPLPSRRSLAIAGSLAALAALTLGVLSLEGVPSIGGAVSSVHRVWTISMVSDRLVDTLVPGGWSALALLLSGLLLALVAPLRAVLRMPPSSLGLRSAGAALVVLATLASASRAHALDFTGEWPSEEHLSLVADDVPASVALERAAEVAGLGFVGSLSVDPPTHVRVRDASLRDVVIAVLGPDAPFVVERTPTLLIVRPRAAPTAEPAAEPTAPPPPLPAPVEPPVVAQPTRAPASDADRRNARERVSFGGDINVGPGEVVESVFTMGGDATIDGEVLHDVVSMGGDVHVRSGGVVHGEIMTMGGEVQIDEGAQAPSGMVIGGGEVEAPDDGIPEADEDVPLDPGAALATWVGETLASGARHALLFLFGLLLLGVWPTRLDAVTRTITTLPGRAVLAGLLSSLVAVVLGLVLTITLVGIPAAVLLALVGAVAVYAGFVAVAALLGRVLPIPALQGSPVLQLAAGIAALFVISLVPVIGTLLSLAAGLVGLGAIVLTRAGTRPAW